LLTLVMTTFSVNAQNPTVVSIIGEAIGGWTAAAEKNMTSTDGGVNWTYSGLNTTLFTDPANGGIKFRANNDWAINWGSADFPGGMGTQGGANIQCTAGSWDVTFNSTTGAYSFTAITPPPTVKLVGTAVTGGMITMNPTNPGVYVLPVTTFLTGTAQFDIDGVLVGGTGLFSGTLAFGATPLISVVGGSYTSVTVDIPAGTFSFVAAPIFPRIGLIGSGTTGTNSGWDQDIAMATTDGVKYKLTQQLFSMNSTSTPTPNAQAFVKFRQDQNWGIPSFGGDTFTATNNVGTGGDIPVSANGTYNVFFNLTTKVYNFVKEGSISLLGNAVGGWNDSAGNPGPVDINQMLTTDNETYTLSNLVMVEGQCKFRTDNNWDLTNYGGVDFPVGSNATSNENIVVGPGQAGTYNVTFIKSTGAYTFTNLLATTSFSKLGFKVSPNPTNNAWNFTSTKDAIVSVQIIDMLGKVVATSTSADLDASALNTGVYFARVATANATATVKVVKN
jgi:starch-binding outer membrane protein SusE/F